MDDIQRKKFKEFLIMLNDIMVDFALLLTSASELYDDFSADAMISEEKEKIANLMIIKEAILEMTDSAQKLIKISEIENKLKWFEVFYCKNFSSFIFDIELDCKSIK